ncbi:MAG: hypothetical protein ABF893_11865 [Gluconacetobacter liquefaciens]
MHEPQDAMESAAARIRAPADPAMATGLRQPQRPGYQRPVAHENIHTQTEREAFRIFTPEVP